MKTTTFLFGITLTIITLSISGAPLTGTYTVGTAGAYTSLTNAGGFFAAVNAQGLSGNVTVNIISDITETGANTLTQWTETGAGNYTIKIQPNSATIRTLSGNPSLPLIDLNGADRVIVDGRFSGTGQFLRFRNTQGRFPSFRFINDARNDTIRYCIVESNNDSTGSGTIQFSTTTGANGNDNNVISNCDIRDRSDAAGTPINAIYSLGTNTSAARYNSGVTISNNNIYNFYLSTSTSQGVSIGDGNTDWIVSGNSFYQTSTRTPVGATGWNVILIGSTSNTNVTISNNYIGGGAPSCAGTAWTINGATANFMYAIRFSAAGTSAASNVNGNTIANIDFTTTPTSNNIIEFVGILASAGLVNIGTTTGNTIGNSSSTGNVKITINGTRTNIVATGIYQGASGSINNNTVGSVNIGGTLTGYSTFNAIYYNSSPVSNVTISNNIIGSSSTANSIITNNTNAILDGIYLAIDGVNLTISGNTIGNMNNTSGWAFASLRGILELSGSTSKNTIQNNTIVELTTASINTAQDPENAGVLGISTGSTDTLQVVSGNIIHGLRATGNDAVYVIGFAHTYRFAKGIMQKNKIYDLTNSSNTNIPGIYGIDAYWGSWNFYNNVVSITNGAASDNPISGHGRENSKNNVPLITEYTVENENSVNGQLIIPKSHFETMQKARSFQKPVSNEQKDVATNGVMIQAIHDEAELGGYYYYNTIYVGGTASSGSANSYCYDRPLSAWPTFVSLSDNIFYNNRTGGTGIHYAVGNEISPPGKNWIPGNYNVFITSNINTVTSWGAGVSLPITQWRDSSTGDKQTWNSTTASVPSTTLFNSISTGDFSINSGNSLAWMVSGKGIAISTVSQDINGNARSSSVASGTTDIGAYEFAATPPSNPVATVDFAPGSGVTSTYTLWGRTIAKIQWGTGGTAYPTAVNIRYYTGLKHPNAVTGNYGGSYYDLTTIGTLTNTTYDITWYFGDNETFTIATPSSSTRLAEYVTPWEVFTVAGIGIYQSELNWTNFTVKTRGIQKLFSFTLTDGNSPLPVSLLHFNALASGRIVTLNWATAWEINNKGFDIERRNQTSTGTFSEWEKVGFVAGNGTTNEQKDYKYSDSKLITGKYQYRLKQLDFNGNSAYYNLNSPDVVDVGKPAAFDLHQNYPNPSNPKTKIDFEIPFSAKVTIKVYDFLGQEVITLVNENKDAGYYTSEFDGSNLASGVYFYRINVQGSGQSYNKTMKMLIVK